ncbi:MAG TPA: FtsX-like permease family protein [Gemmatimonadales bacterium]
MANDAPNAVVLARVTGDSERQRAALDADLTAVDSSAVSLILKMEDARATQLFPYSTAYWVASAIGAIALLLTLTGVYGVLAYVIERRTREIGLRIALGASTTGVVGLVLGQMARLAMAGLGIGLVLALGVSRLLSQRIYIVNMFDPMGYVVGCGIVLAACVAAAAVPSRRAAAIEPVTALRHD